MARVSFGWAVRVLKHDGSACLLRSDDGKNAWVARSKADAARIAELWDGEVVRVQYRDPEVIEPMQGHSP